MAPVRSEVSRVNPVRVLSVHRPSIFCLKFVEIASKILTGGDMTEPKCKRGCFRKTKIEGLWTSQSLSRARKIKKNTHTSVDK